MNAYRVQIDYQGYFQGEATLFTAVETLKGLDADRVVADLKGIISRQYENEHLPLPVFGNYHSMEVSP